MSSQQPALVPILVMLAKTVSTVGIVRRKAANVEFVNKRVNPLRGGMRADMGEETGNFHI
jgi:hypothetical protein